MLQEKSDGGHSILGQPPVVNSTQKVMKSPKEVDQKVVTEIAHTL